MTRILIVLLAALVAAFSLAGSPYCGSLEPFSARMLPLTHSISVAAEEFNVPWPLLASVVITESGGITDAKRFEPFFDLGATNWNAAVRLGWSGDDLRTSIGLMQTVGATAWRYGWHYPPDSLLVPINSLRLGAKILRDAFNRTGSWDAALASYNGGPQAALALEAGRPFNLRYVSHVFDGWLAIQECLSQ